ncbi:MAG: hypothetical protein GXO73_11685 [Calditrichaeota bacterium]|nr:hypothetical protein [Calditrichota bacterium]
MTAELTVLMATGASIALFHTLFGPDHYIPFIAMAKAGKWSLRKTAWITTLCGIGHVGSSVVLGLLGIALGLAVGKLEVIESTRGNLAAWALIALGLVYFAWGVQRAIRNKPHAHPHVHQGVVHSHVHTHHDEHLHVHEQDESPNLTPWILFTIFVLGPCEPLIPLLMYPAAQKSLAGLAAVTLVFGVITVATMLAVVLLSVWGTSFVRLAKLERYTHALAGFTIFLSGLVIQVFGL